MENELPAQDDDLSDLEEQLIHLEIYTGNSNMSPGCFDFVLVLAPF